MNVSQTSLGKSTTIHIHFSTYETAAIIFAALSDGKGLEILYTKGWSTTLHSDTGFNVSFDTNTWLDYYITNNHSTSNTRIGVIHPSDVEVTFTVS